MDFREFEQFAHRLADAAAEATLPLFQSPHTVTDKGAAGFDPVTEADRGAEAAMRRLIEAEYPGHGILGEELGETGGDGGWRWVLDPVDGTRSFIAGIPLWTTIIGLEHEGAPVYGMVDQPYVGDRFWGHAEASFRRNRFGLQDALRVRGCPRLAEATLMTTTPAMMPDEASLRRYRAVEQRARLVRYSADAYGYMALSSGRVDVVVEAGLQAYDVVGLIPVIEGAGGIVTSWTGGSAAGGGAIVASGDPALHEDVLAILGS